MKRRSCCSGRLPLSRRLAPSLLGAFASGAFTLSVMPCAAAAPTVAATVTEDLETSEGVAGSTDGTAATITVGTDGGGKTPKIGEKNADGEFIKWHPVTGAWRQSDTPNDTILLKGSKAVIKSGTMHHVHGAYAHLTRGGSAEIENGEVEITGGTIEATYKDPWYEKIISGGLAATSFPKNTTEDAGKAEAKVTKSHVEITGGERREISYIAGGYARSKIEGLYSSGKISAVAVASENVNHLKDIALQRESLYGGYAQISYNSEKINAVLNNTVQGNDNQLFLENVTGRPSEMAGGSAVAALDMPMYATIEETAEANRNTLKIEKSALQGSRDIYGGYAKVAGRKGVVQAEASQNKVHLTEVKTAHTFIGGYAFARNNQQAQGAAMTANANKNEIHVRDIQSVDEKNRPSFIGGNILTGGHTDIEANVSENKITCEGNGMYDSITGGKVSINHWSPGEKGRAAASKNQIILRNGHYRRGIRGGSVKSSLSYASAQGSDTSAMADGNIIEISDGTYEEEIVGGHAHVRNASQAEVSASDNKIKINNTNTSNGKPDLSLSTLHGKIFAGVAEEYYSAGMPEDTAKATVKAKDNQILLQGCRCLDEICSGYAEIDQKNTKSDAFAMADGNSIEMSGSECEKTIHGGHAFVKSASPAEVSASSNTITINDTNTSNDKPDLNAWKLHGKIFGGKAQSVPEGNTVKTTVTAKAKENRLFLRSGHYLEDIYGGYAEIQPKDAQIAAASAMADGNSIEISGGTYEKAIYGGYAAAEQAATAKASASHNTITIQGTPDLSQATLYGGVAKGKSLTVDDNALVIKETKGIRTKAIQNFQKLDFYIPAGMTESDTMLTVTSSTDTDLKGAAITAYLPNSATADRLRLLYTEYATILTDEKTAMNVNYSDLAIEKTAFSITEDRKSLILTKTMKPPQPEPQPPQPEPQPQQPEPQPKPEPQPQPEPQPPQPEPQPKPEPQPPQPEPQPKPEPQPPKPEPQQSHFENNRKSLVETMVGSVAFLREGTNLFTGAGLANASAEAATAPLQTFAPFAVAEISSMRYNTGSHVDMKGRHLFVGFSREVTRDEDRLIFGPVVEYGRGTYDSYVGNAHGNGSVRTLGIGGFAQKEQADGMFYEGSVHFGRANLSYAANLPTPTSYDTSAGYIGAHIGFGQRFEEESGTERELYARYHYTRQNSTSATLSTGYDCDFDAVESHRLRTGARWKFPQKGGSLILGASLQYEFGGEANATLHVGGTSYTAPAPSLQGFSGSLELGWKTEMSENASLDLGVEGWLGKQRGVIVKAGFEWKI